MCLLLFQHLLQLRSSRSRNLSCVLKGRTFFKINPKKLIERNCKQEVNLIYTIHTANISVSQGGFPRLAHITSNSEVSYFYSGHPSAFTDSRHWTGHPLRARNVGLNTSSDESCKLHGCGTKAMT